MYQEINECRVCKNKNLVEVSSLGNLALTGIFPRYENDIVDCAPLMLVKCMGDDNQYCELLQLKHSYKAEILYGESYGYRSGLNQNMVEHLNNKVKHILKFIELKENNIIIDIGSNDATTLKAYSQSHQYRLIGIDPVGKKFIDFYPSHIELIPDFFSSDSIKKVIGNKKAKIITSFSMFYDLENPLKFMRDIYAVLDDDGLWCFEQSYLPLMLKMNSFDTICHEHLEYYHLTPILWMCKQVGFKIIDVQLNNINGGSISIIVAKEKSHYSEAKQKVQALLLSEQSQQLSSLFPFLEFSRKISEVRHQISSFFDEANKKKKTVCGLGASTKGNVILQYFNISKNQLSVIGEVNTHKYGCFTPKTLIPIISEKEVMEMNPDYFFILPWHFKDSFLKRNDLKGKKCVFPLPNLEIVTV